MKSGPADGNPSRAASAATGPHGSSAAAAASGSSLERGGRERAASGTCGYLTKSASGGSPPRPRATATACSSPPSWSTSPRSSRVSAGPDPSPSHLMDIVYGHGPTGSHFADKVVVDTVQPAGQLLVLLLCVLVENRHHPGVPSVADLVVAYAQPAKQFGERQFASEHPDGAGEGARLGHDYVRRRGDKVASGAGDVTHRDNDRFARLLDPADLAPDDVGSDVRATRAVDPEYDHFYSLVLGRRSQRGTYRVRAHAGGNEAGALRPKRMMPTPVAERPLRWRWTTRPTRLVRDGWRR